MSDKIPIFYGSYRSDRQGICLAHYLVGAFAARGASPELIDAKALDLPILDRMYKEYLRGSAPAVLETLAETTRRPGRQPGSSRSCTPGLTATSRCSSAKTRSWTT